MEGLSYKEGGGLGYSEKNEGAEVMLWRINRPQPPAPPSRYYLLHEASPDESNPWSPGVLSSEVSAVPTPSFMPTFSTGL